MARARIDSKQDDPSQPLDDAAGSRLAIVPESKSSEGASILIVDSREIGRRMLRSMLRDGGYRIYESGTAAEAEALMERESIDLVILDLVLPEVSGPEFCRHLKASRKTRSIPLLMLTSVQGVENEIVGISMGADEFLIQPVHPKVVRTRVKSMLRNKALIDSKEEAETILFALAQAVEQRDHGTGLHCQRLASYSVMMGYALNLSPIELTALYRGGFLHDIGKISVPDAILFKQGALTSEEWSTMRQHPIQGENICKPMRSLAPVLPIIRSHHERRDGSGYPDGLSGDRIPLLARILQVVDIYDALTSARSYKAALTRGEAFAIMRNEIDRGWRDAELVNLFFSLVKAHPENAEIEGVQNSLANMNLHLRE